MSSRRSAVALRHVAFEDLGLLAPIMEREDWDVSFCEAAVDDLSHRSIRNADLVIVLGGPVGMAPHIPFGGAKQSGIGTEFAEEGLGEFTQL
jgi:GMP synthase (glutamine-hydrolysing)